MQYGTMVLVAVAVLVGAAVAPVAANEISLLGQPVDPNGPLTPGQILFPAPSVDTAALGGGSTVPMPVPGTALPSPTHYQDGGYFQLSDVNQQVPSPTSTVQIVRLPDGRTVQRRYVVVRRTYQDRQCVDPRWWQYQMAQERLAHDRWRVQMDYAERYRAMQWAYAQQAHQAAQQRNFMLASGMMQFFSTLALSSAGPLDGGHRSAGFDFDLWGGRPGYPVAVPMRSSYEPRIEYVRRSDIGNYPIREVRPDPYYDRYQWELGTLGLRRQGLYDAYGNLVADEHDLRQRMYAGGGIW